MSTPKYNKYDPDKVHIINGSPFIINKADNLITQFNAEQNFKKAIRTMHSWASRAFKLAVAQPDAEIREYDLEHLEWQLDDIQWWLEAMRKALEEQRGKQRKQDTLDKILALAERSPFPEEADTARRMAARRKEQQ